MAVDETFGMNIDRIIVILGNAIALLDNREEGGRVTGICRLFDELLISHTITEAEEYHMKLLLGWNKPDKKQFVQFTLEESWTDNLVAPIEFSAYWWIPGHVDSSTISVRHNYLSALLKKYQQLNKPKNEKR